MDPASESKWFEEEAPASGPTESAPAGPPSGFLDARIPALVAQIALAMNPLLYIAVFALGILDAIVTEVTGWPWGFAEAVLGSADYLELGLRFFTAGCFITWLFRVSKNVHLLAEVAPEYGPGTAIFAWFIPCANLWLPYQVVREIDAKSDPASLGASSPLIGAWWAAWVATVVLLQIMSRSSSDEAALFFGLALTAAQIAAATLAILVIRRIQKNQIALATRADTQSIAAQFE